jgi:phosphonate metabolism-associated iron-containing alcohol dehydrogenase
MGSIFNPVDIYIGEDSIDKLPSLTKNRKFIVITSRGFNSRSWNRYIPEAESIIDTVNANPSISEISNYINSIKNIKCDTLVAIGGGSVIDVAKSLSVLNDPSQESILDILKIGDMDLRKHLDVIAIPTTAGTGAEVTPFATIWDDKNKKKYSLGSSELYPTNAIIFPEFSLTLDQEQTAFTGLDALSHCFESLWNKNATPFTKSIAFHAIDTILDTLAKLLENLNNIEYRTKMSWASCMGGLCINQTKTALAHSISYPLTSHLGIPHGLASGVFLPEILNFNLDNDSSGRMKEIYSKLSNTESLSERLNYLYQILNQHSLFQMIKDNKSKIYSLVNQMINPSRSINNIVDANHSDIRTIIDMFFQKTKIKNS